MANQLFSPFFPFCLINARYHYLYDDNGCGHHYVSGISGSIAVIITPLISLMLDQKEKFVQKGL